MHWPVSPDSTGVASLLQMSWNHCKFWILNSESFFTVLEVSDDLKGEEGVAKSKEIRREDTNVTIMSESSVSTAGDEQSDAEDILKKREQVCKQASFFVVYSLSHLCMP